MIDGGLRKLFSKHLTKAHWQAVETGAIGQGVPDHNVCFPGGVELWLEYKRTEANAVRIDPEQVAWCERRLRMGGRVFLAVRQQWRGGPRRAAVDNLLLYHGRTMRAVLLYGLVTKPLGMWSGGPARWDWDHVQILLTR